MADIAQAPLAGRTIVVTRSREQASELTRRLLALGAHVIEIPTIAIVPPRSYEPLDAALRALHTYDWLIVTSANTARVLHERTHLLSRPPASQPQTVAVGRATADALRQVGFRVDLVPLPAVAESIVAILKDQVAGRRVLLVRAEVARDLLPLALTEAGALVTIVDAYRTVMPEGSEELVSATFRPSGLVSFDALTFTSSSTVKNLAALLRQVGIDWAVHAKVFSIGPVTSSTLREHGIEPDREAAHHDIDGLVEAIVQGLAPE